MRVLCNIYHIVQGESKLTASAFVVRIQQTQNRELVNITQ